MMNVISISTSDKQGNKLCLTQRECCSQNPAVGGLCEHHVRSAKWCSVTVCHHHLDGSEGVGACWRLSIGSG